MAYVIPDGVVPGRVAPGRVIPEGAASSLAATDFAAAARACPERAVLGRVAWGGAPPASPAREGDLHHRVGLDRTARGRTGEEAAALFLSARGYVVLATNQRTPLGELDLICRDSTGIVIVEVKSRSSTQYGEGLEAIGPRKATRLRASAAWWLSDRGLFPCPVRFDAVEVIMDGRGSPRSLHHLPNVLEG